MQPTLSFLDLASTLYTGKSFEPPRAPDASGAESPGDWVHYDPSVSDPPQDFDAFMRTPQFAQVRQQISERIDDCKAFARQHLGPSEARKAVEGFDTFQERLRLDEGLGFFSRDQLQLLCSFGKRCLDDLCVLLRQPDLELHQRQRVISELGDQVTRCRASGPAFMEALSELQRPFGSLHDRYWTAQKDLFDQTIRSFVGSLPSATDPGWLQSMEIHLVNRLRLELGLPGADPHDAFSRGTIVTPHDVLACSVALLSYARPVSIARLLAEQYRAQLSALAVAELKGREGTATDDAHSGIAPELDPGQDSHLGAIVKAHGQLGSTFVGVNLGSVLEEDVDTGHFSWRHGDALVARDLLMELARQELIKPPVQSVAASGTSEDGPWTLCQLDDRLLYVEQQVGSGGAGHTVLALPGVAHVKQMLENSRPTPMLAALVQQELIETAPARELQQFEAKWLQSRHQASALLHRLGPSDALQWAQGQTLNDDGLRLLLPEAAAARDMPLLQYLLDAVKGPPKRLAGLAVNGALHEAVKAGPEAVALWLDALTREGPSLPAATLIQALTTPDGRSATEALLSDGPSDGAGGARSEALDRQLELGLALARRSDDPQRVAAHSLRAPMQALMRAGSLEVLQQLVRQVAAARQEGLVDAGTVAGLLDGAEGKEGCRGAVLALRPDMVDWFNKTVCSLAASGALTPEQTSLLLTGLGVATPVGFACFYKGSPECLEAHLAGVMEGVRRGWVSLEVLGTVLLFTSGDQNGVSKVMTEATGRYAQVWADAVLAAHRDGVVSADFVHGLLAAPSRLAAGPGGELAWVPLPFLVAASNMKLPGHQQASLSASFLLDHWATLVCRLVAGGALTHPQALQLLTGVNGDSPVALQAAAFPSFRAHAVEALHRMHLHAYREGVVNDDELVRLLEGRRPDGTGPSVFDTAGMPAARAVLRRLATQVRVGRLPSALFQRLAASAARSGASTTDARARLEQEFLKLLAPSDA